MRRSVRFVIHLLWALVCAMMMLASPAFAADPVAKKVSAERTNKKSPADAAIGKKCLTCHNKEDDPGIYGEWKRSTHAAKNVDCYDCHKAKEGDKAAFKHEGAFIHVVVTPKTCQLP